MSRIGRKPIAVPAGVDVKIDGNTVTVKGPKGSLTESFHKDMAITLEGGEIIVTRPSEDKLHRSLHGLTRTLVANMVEGCTNGFKKELEINGVGYRAAKAGKKVTLILGFSHQVFVEDTDEITVDVPAPNKLIVSGMDKQKVGQFAAEIRELRPPEPYKGKGIKYANEVIIRKEGKAGKGKK
ncbi:50S ribosomal protein L6 [Hydrogenoanaerobacterium sp.]|uniref:50S ribosomal protein L6 n=1 Tax=Hydrogenoanaerobacterium sp. TaxID=2953763 RepID=UPI0028A2DDF5|nr:50S ribosomal protein L6 [Hydrogenoanaerobacterium sp.]